MDHLSIIKPWVEAMGLETRKIPTEKELNKALKNFEAIRYTWKDMNVLNFNKKGKKVEIYLKKERKLVDWAELEKTQEFKKFSDAMEALKKYTKDNDCSVVRDHCHFTGEFRGAAHNHCNRQYRKTYNIPVFFHNLTGYDGHIVFEHLTSLKLKKAPTVIAKSLEKYLSIKIGPIEFKDSAQFLSSSLDKLAQNLKTKSEKEGSNLKDAFPNTYQYFKKECKDVDENAFELLTRKGVYPYEYMDRWEKMQEKSLPTKEQYFSKLTGKSISDKDYEFAEKIWKEFKLKNLGQLHDLYLGTDVALLSDVFESFRGFSLKHYRLDPAHFLTAPSLSWSACLKYTNIQLEIPSDPTMCMFFDKGLIGGISFISNLYARANNAGL